MREAVAALLPRLQQLGRGNAPVVIRAEWTALAEFVEAMLAQDRLDAGGTDHEEDAR